MTEHVAVDEAVQVTTYVNISPRKLGKWLARQMSDVQAEVIAAFADEMVGLNSPDWQLQSAYIRQEWSVATADVVSDVLHELTPEVSS